MATTVLTDAFVSIDGNDISDHVVGVTLTFEGESLDETAMGDTTRTMKGGLFNWSFEVEVHQDWAASNIDSIMFPLVNTVVVVIFRPDSAAVSATNPNYTGSALITGWPPLGNSVGELATSTISGVSAGALTRAVA